MVRIGSVGGAKSGDFLREKRYLINALNAKSKSGIIDNTAAQIILNSLDWRHVGKSVRNGSTLEMKALELFNYRKYMNFCFLERIPYRHWLGFDLNGIGIILLGCRD